MFGDDLPIGTGVYRVKRVPAVTMWHVTRRLGPVLKGVADAMQKFVAAGVKTPSDLLDKPGGIDVIQPLAEALAKLSDGDSDFIMNTCLDACERRIDPPNGGPSSWGPVRSRNGQLVYQDLDMPELLQLTFAVLQENLSRFFPSPPSQATPSAPPPT